MLEIKIVGIDAFLELLLSKHAAYVPNLSLHRLF